MKLSRSENYISYIGACKHLKEAAKREHGRARNRRTRVCGRFDSPKLVYLNCEIMIGGQIEHIRNVSPYCHVVASIRTATWQTCCRTCKKTFIAIDVKIGKGLSQLSSKLRLIGIVNYVTFILPALAGKRKHSRRVS